MTYWKLIKTNQLPYRIELNHAKKKILRIQ